MTTVMRSPRGGSKHKRSYLDKGPSKEQTERRNFLKGKLEFDGEASDSNQPSGATLPDDDGEFLSLSSIEGTQDGISAKKRISSSLSPKKFGKRVLGRRERPRRTNVAPDDPKRRSVSNASALPSGKPREDRHSLSPGRMRRRVLSGLSRTSSRVPEPSIDEGFDNTRRSLIADKKELDDLQSRYEQFSDDEPVDDGTLLERVARRVAARRGQLSRAKTDGNDLSSMQSALKRRQETDHRQDEEIGGLWAMGLKALEKVYDDINS